MIVEPYARIVYSNNTTGELTPFVSKDIGITMLRFIEAIGRVSHRSEEKQTSDSWKRFIESIVLQHGDWSITEHMSLVVEALVDRGITHEWVRHRIGAYTQESTRFVDYLKKDNLKFIKPVEIPEFNEEGETTEDFRLWNSVIGTAQSVYMTMRKLAFTPQIARSVLPNALASKIIVTYNLRNWRHFFLMRTSKETHPQFKQVTIPLLQQFKDTIPLLYDDIEPERRQVDNLRMVR